MGGQEKLKYAQSHHFFNRLAQMSDYDEYDEYADEYDMVRVPIGGGGGKKKRAPTHVGKVRCGGIAWVGNVKACPKSCKKKCCAKPASSV